VLNRVLIAAVMVTLTGLAAALLAGHGPWAGPELFAFSETHGVNLGDLPVVAAWIIGMACCWGLWRRE
jgi:hypothetical protein